MRSNSGGKGFFGWRVARAAFVLALFGWGVGFYGPPVFLSVIHETRGWSIALISAAISVQFLSGALLGANLPALHRRFGLDRVTRYGVLTSAAGLLIWACATAAWHMFAAALLSGIGWGCMSAAALNAIVSPWFVHGRPAALGLAYNGGSAGGIVFSPLWVIAIGALGFFYTSLMVGAIMVATVWWISSRVFAKTPQAMGLLPDGDAVGQGRPSLTSALAVPLPGRQLWRSRPFITLTAGMGLSLFAQIGLIAHLYSLLVPALGERGAGLAMALVTVMAIMGRTLLGRLMPPGIDRRLVAAGSYSIQIVGSLMLTLADGSNIPLLVLGVVLFGLGFGNATSLPPLIAQVEFVEADVQRAVALAVAISQTGYAVAPVLFGIIRELTTASAAHPGAAPVLFCVAAAIQALAATIMVIGRRT